MELKNRVHEYKRQRDFWCESWLDERREISIRHVHQFLTNGRNPVFMVILWFLHQQDQPVPRKAVMAYTRDKMPDYTAQHVLRTLADAELLTCYHHTSLGMSIALTEVGTLVVDHDRMRHGVPPPLAPGMTLMPHKRTHVEERAAELAALMAQGLSTKAIATKMQINAQTLKEYIRERLVPVSQSTLG